MTKNSKCFNKEQLKSEVNRMIESFGGCIVEEFIVGKEFTCLVLENSEDYNNPHGYTPFMI